MYLGPHLKYSASTFEIVGKSKEISQEIRKRMVELLKSVSSLGFQILEGGMFIYHYFTICKFKHHGNVQPSHSSGRRWALCPRDERVLLPNVRINPRNKAKDAKSAKDLVKMLARAGKKVSLSTVKQERPLTGN